MMMMTGVTLCPCDHGETDTDQHTLRSSSLYTVHIPDLSDLWLVQRCRSGAEQGRVQGHRPISGPRTKKLQLWARIWAQGQFVRPYDSS